MRARKGVSPQEVAFKLIQCLCIQLMTEISTAVVWVWCLLVSETSWPRSLDAEIAQSSSWRTDFLLLVHCAGL